MSLKYRTSAGTSASNFSDLVVKVGDTLPIGSEIDYDGQTAPAGWQEVDDPNVYSTTETKVGTWINGKPIYRKVIDYYPTSLIGEVGTTTNVSIAHNITNFGNIIKVDMVDETGYVFPVFSSASGTYITVECGITKVDSTNINFRIINDNWSSRHFYITLEYTKTTD